jgi:endonuclease YncB( thermonuclease family)
VAYRKHALDYVNAEREAKTAKRGIWAWGFEMPEDYRARIAVKKESPFPNLWGGAGGRDLR